MNRNVKFYAISFFVIICFVSVAWSFSNLTKLVKDFGNHVIPDQQSSQNLFNAIASKTNKSKGNTVQTTTLEHISQQVVQLGQSGDLQGLEQLENSINNSQIINDIGLYTEVMIKICGAYNTYDFKDKNQFLLARKCAKNSLKEIDKMPIGRAINLVAQLGGDNEYLLGVVPENKWDKDRTERAKYWFRAWQRLDNALINNYNFEANRPIYHPKMTVEERKKAEEYNRLSFLKRDRDTFLADFSRFLINAYTKPPYNTLELKTYLQKYVLDSQLRERILSEVDKKILLTEH